IEQYGDVTFVVLRPARYVDHDEVVELGEIHVFLGPNFVITVRHADEPDLAVVRARLEGDPKLLAMGPPAVLYAILDRVVDDHVTRVNDRVEGFRQLLTNLLDIDNALVARRQNEEMARMTQAGYEQNEQVKRISSWAAILFAPTLVASIYGMNFHHMPEL